MKGKIYQTICPGCNIGCSLYVRENEQGTISIDYMKSSPVNLGKLCRFGVKLPSHYSHAINQVDGSESSFEESTLAAVSRLKNADNVAFLSVGNTTNEEHLALKEIASLMGTVVNTGMGIYADLPQECHPVVDGGTSLNEIENVGKIALFIDPYVQYPLIVRRLLAAKKNGAYIISVGYNDLNLADESKLIKPEQYESELDLDSDSLILADIHPHTNSTYTKHLINLSLRTGARIMFMKPFINAEGVNLLSKGSSGRKSLSDLMKDIDEGIIKTLVTLDSDPVELMPNSDVASGILKKLENLIVISSRESPVNKLANVVIATEPQYAKAGSYINVEGKLQKNSASGKSGIQALSTLSEGLGGEAIDYYALHEQVLEILVGKYASPKNPKLVCEVMDTISLEETGEYLVYLYNPFMWFDQPDENDFVLLNMHMVKKLGIRKGGLVKLTSSCGETRMRYSVGNIPDGLIIATKKLAVATGITTLVLVEAV